MLSDLPRDLAEEVLCKLPVTSLRGVRSTCKKWNSLSKDRIFKRRHISEAKKKQRSEFHQVVMMLNYRISLFSVNLHNPSVERVGQLISQEDEDRVDICNIFHCHGFLLCTAKDKSRVVVWNPCSGETRRLRPRNSFSAWDRYALGYQMNKDMYTHKVLRFVDSYDSERKPLRREFEIYSFNSNSWKVLDVNPDWDIEYFHRGLSLHGNTYWFARDKNFQLGVGHSYFLLCFDFTTEKFGPRLSVPFHPFIRDNVALSSVRENQIAVLFQKTVVPYTLEIWISSKIEPNAVSYDHKVFLKVDMKPVIGFDFCYLGGSFFVDEKNKVAVVVDKNRRPTRNIAYFIGKKGYFKQVDLGESKRESCWPLLCSYVPSSVQIEQAAPHGNQTTA